MSPFKFSRPTVDDFVCITLLYMLLTCYLAIVYSIVVLVARVSGLLSEQNHDLIAAEPWVSYVALLVIAPTFLACASLAAQAYLHHDLWRA